MNIRLAGAIALIGLVVFTSPASAGHECVALLTGAELKSAAGVVFDEVSDPVSFSEGQSQCSFFAHTDDGLKQVMFSYWNATAIREGMVSAESIPEFFDMMVRSHEEVGGVKGTKLEGIGVRSFFWEGEERTATIYAEMQIGFAEIIGKGLTRPQLEAVAKAAAAPTAK
jgi:hypothetical protein